MRKYWELLKNIWMPDLDWKEHLPAAFQIAQKWALEDLARWLLTQPKMRQAIETTQFYEYHLQKVKDLDSGFYCVYHECDMSNCPPGFHD